MHAWISDPQVGVAAKGKTVRWRAIVAVAAAKELVESL